MSTPIASATYKLRSQTGTWSLKLILAGSAYKSDKLDLVEALQGLIDKIKPVDEEE